MPDSNTACFKDEPVASSQQGACPKDPPPAKSKVLSGFFAVRMDGAPPKGKKGPVDVNLVKTKSAIVGSKLCLVIDTSDLKGGSVTVEILGGDDAAIVAKDAALTVLEGGAEKTSLTAKVGNWAEDKNIKNAAAYTNKAVIELELKPETLEKTKEWRANIGKATDKKALFHLKVTATGGTDTEYTTEDDTLASPDKEKSIFLNKKDQHFELYACFCNKEFTEADIRAIYADKKLFTVKCPLPADKKTYEAFTKELNTAMKDHSMSTCLRKAHFLAQIQAESDRLNTTVEYASGDDYDKFTHEDDYNNYTLFKKHQKDPKNPYKAFDTAAVRRGYNRYLECDDHGHKEKGDGPKYKGRGLIQLTWKDTYQAYFNAIGKAKLIDTPEQLGSDLHLACDSAGWYWNSRSSLGNLNGFADKDDLMAITLGVNGSVHAERTHYGERKKNLKSFLDIMKVKEACQTQNVTAKTIGEYKLATSAIAGYKYGKNNKAAIEKLDD